LEEQQKKYPDTKKLIDKILSVKPGITGPWQTSGRNEIPFDKRAQLDAEYADHRTLFRDIIILAKTPKAMLSKW
jgi:lipopolysaccharide/colanic/teichoic acid biosynthesis glycosyltransferase